MTAILAAIFSLFKRGWRFLALRRWRLEVWLLDLRRGWQYLDWRSFRTHSRLRSLWVALLSAALVWLLWKLSDNRNDFGEWLRSIYAAFADPKNLAQSGFATLLLAIIGAPFAFLIWLFRDQNNREQIENQRKDVNLKDFQRLSEWAAGLHLPETKKTHSITKADDKAETSETEEHTEPEPHPTLPAPSRREGAASLQVAAIYQLQAFLQGDYGEYFQRPAFQLLKSIWLAITAPHLAEFVEVMRKKPPEDVLQRIVDAKVGALQQLLKKHEEREIFRKALTVWRRELHDTLNSPLGEAINIALAAQHGRLMRLHAQDLPLAIFTGLNSQLTALEQPLELHQLNLQGAQLQMANLSGAMLQATNLSATRLQGANLSGAKLQGANLRAADLLEANLGEAQLQGADLCGVKLQDAYLREAELQSADLRVGRLQGARLVGAKLQGANLSGAHLQGALLLNVSTNAATKFQNCECDEQTRVFRAKPHGGWVWMLNYFPSGYDINEAETFKLRQELRALGLELPAVLYEKLWA